MSVTYALFSRWMTAKKYRSALAACNALRVARASATNWKKGGNAKATTIERMALDLGENAPALVLAAASEQTPSDAEERQTLERLARQIGYAALF